MKDMYRIKSMARIGVWVVAALLFWLLFPLCIPTFHAEVPDRQVYSIRHQELRDNNPLYTDLFLKSIKSHNGYLILGTSESNDRPKGNYYNFLNADTSILSGFSLVAGAGRTACTYFPLIQSNDNVSGLKVIYYINPAYWCGKLAPNSADYFQRYLSYTVYKKANRPKRKDVEDILNKNLQNTQFVDRASDFLAYYVDRWRRKFYQDMAFNLDDSKFKNGVSWLYPKNPNALKTLAPPDTSQYDYAFNIVKSFDIHSYTMHPNVQETYRFDELRTMVRLCKSRKVDVTYVVGPYNKVAYQQANPTELPYIQEIVDNIRHLLEEEGVSYLDCTEFSSTPGFFADWQHHTSYGGYLLYQKMREYVLEKENR